MDQIDCPVCKGKGSFPAMGFMVILDWPCSLCQQTGKVMNPQSCGYVPQHMHGLGGWPQPTANGEAARE